MPTALVTGSSSGFGRLTALALARAGHRVFASMRDPGARNAAVAAELRAIGVAEGLALEPIELDVTDEASIAAAVQDIEARAGGIDVVVNNAGLAAAGLLETFTADDAHRLFDVNVMGPLRVNRAVLPSMRARGAGLLVYLSSTDGREMMPFLALYCSSKFALEALAEGLAYEVGPLGIDSVIVQPGTFPTTSILKNLVAASAPERAAGYGAVAEMPGQVFAGLGELVSSGNAPDPILVANAIVDVVAMPPRTRPLRVVVDASGFDGTAQLNDAARIVQRALLGKFGLSSLGSPWLE